MPEVVRPMTMRPMDKLNNEYPFMFEIINLDFSEAHLSDSHDKFYGTYFKISQNMALTPMSDENLNIYFNKIKDVILEKTHRGMIKICQTPLSDTITMVVDERYIVRVTRIYRDDEDHVKPYYDQLDKGIDNFKNKDSIFKMLNDYCDKKPLPEVYKNKEISREEVMERIKASRFNDT